jgi:hypothetical protein
MITYMMGTPFYHAKNKVEKRVREIEARKDAEEQQDGTK